jgi:hypothetical protein
MFADEFVKFFDIHDLGEYWSEMPEAHFEVDITRKTHLFALDPELANKVIEIAKARELSSEAIINAWLKEKICEQMLVAKECSWQRKGKQRYMTQTSDTLEMLYAIENQIKKYSQCFKK